MQRPVTGHTNVSWVVLVEAATLTRHLTNLPVVTAKAYGRRFNRRDGCIRARSGGTSDRKYITANFWKRVEGCRRFVGRPDEKGGVLPTEMDGCGPGQVWT